MKGVVFVELLSMAETLLGEDTVDDILENSNLASGGAYSSVGNYPCSELMTLVGAFSQSSGQPAAVLQAAFGNWIFGKFSESYTTFFEGKTDAFSMLEVIESEVHVEVRKIYPEAELPSFHTQRIKPDLLEMIYASERPLIDFCQGMIEACLAHFGQKAIITKEHITTSACFAARFRIQLVP